MVIRYDMIRSEMKKKGGSGRPPKFDEESYPITVTLPRRIVEKLESIDPDRAKAIVKCVDSIDRQTCDSDTTVNLVQISKRAWVIIVPPSQFLASIEWLQLIEISPLRFLLAIPTGTPVESLEIAIMDHLEHSSESAEKGLLVDLRQKLSLYRRMKGLTKGEILYITKE